MGKSFEIGDPVQLGKWVGIVASLWAPGNGQPTQVGVDWNNGYTGSYSDHNLTLLPSRKRIDKPNAEGDWWGSFWDEPKRVFHVDRHGSGMWQGKDVWIATARGIEFNVNHPGVTWHGRVNPEPLSMPFEEETNAPSP